MLTVFSLVVRTQHTSSPFHSRRTRSHTGAFAQRTPRRRKNRQSDLFVEPRGHRVFFFLELRVDGLSFPVASGVSCVACVRHDVDWCSQPTWLRPNVSRGHVSCPFLVFRGVDMKVPLETPRDAFTPRVLIDEEGGVAANSRSGQTSVPCDPRREGSGDRSPDGGVPHWSGQRGRTRVPATRKGGRR